MMVSESNFKELNQSFDLNSDLLNQAVTKHENIDFKHTDACEQVTESLVLINKIYKHLLLDLYKLEQIKSGDTVDKRTFKSILRDVRSSHIRVLEFWKILNNHSLAKTKCREALLDLRVNMLSLNGSLKLVKKPN